MDCCSISIDSHLGLKAKLSSHFSLNTNHGRPLERVNTALKSYEAVEWLDMNNTEITMFSVQLSQENIT